MLDKLSATLKKTTDKIANAIFLDKKLVDSIIKDLQRALIEADVNVQLVLEITKKIKKAALDERIKEIEKKEHIIKLLHGELIKILGETREVKLKKKNKFLMLGLYGAGKTTTISKLALYYSKRGKKVCTVGLDVHRPAASEQLKQLSEKLNIISFIDPEEKDPLKIWEKNKKEIEKYDLILIDTAGRDALDKELVKEISLISKKVKPTETFLIIPADIGQTAKKQTQTFKEAVNITGVIITRMDSSAKAGGALTACYESKVPVIFIGTGEKASDLEHFNPESFLSRLLGMGDLESLMEKITSVVDQKEIEKTQKRMEEGKLTLRDVQTQLESIESIGSMDKILGMIPGLKKEKIPDKALATQKEKIKIWKNAINSMTEEEIENPEILEKQTSRMQRIAKGAGCKITDIRSLIKQYKMLKELTKSQSAMAGGELDQKTMMKLARKLGKKKFKI
ncbi:signal recognition particle protein [Candidatus Parvarchaeota archaeon]|nr:MAG: signal recognition particle protein [Candidatus Parvarchaeota archaeon]PXY71470.1 MAG: signal recognition particle protein [Candidatus Parvarchaeota archaeon]